MIFLAAVTDLEITMSIGVKVVLILLSCFGFIYNIIQVSINKLKNQQRLRKLLVIIFLLAIFPLGRFIYLDYYLLFYPVYTKGKTMEMCSVLALGKGIRFEYEADGKLFYNCNNYYPLSLQNIIMPDGVYQVRYAAGFPSSGRMNFKMPVK